MPVSDPSRRRRRLRVGLILGVNLLLAGLVFAAFMYVTERYIERARPSTLVYEPHPFQRHVLAADQSYRRGRVAFTIGPHHLRGPEPTQPKPEGSIRLYAVGGSSVFDHLVPEGQSWPERLAAELSSRGVPRVASFNGGVPGYSSRETLAAYFDRVSRYAPDVVVFYLGWNDVKYMKTFLEGVDPDRHYGYRGIFETQYRFLQAPRPLRNGYALIRMLRERMGQEGLPENAAAAALSVVEEEPTPIAWRSTAGLGYWRRNVEAFVTQVKADGALPVLVAQNTLVTADLPAALREKIVYRYVQLDHAALVEVNDAMVEVLADVARQHRVPFVDVRDRMNGRAEYFSDHVHMKAEGSRAFAGLLAEALAPVLTSTGTGLERNRSSRVPSPADGVAGGD